MTDNPEAENYPDSPATPPADPEDFTEPWFRTHPISGVLTGVILLAVLLVGGLRLLNKELGNDEPNLRFLTLLGLAGLGLVLVVTLVSFLVWQRTYFKVTDQFLFKKYQGRGRETVQISLSSVTGVDLNRNLLAKVLGLGELIVRPSAGDEVTLKYLTLEQATTLRSQILNPGITRPQEQGTQLYFLPVRIQVRALARQMLAVGLPAFVILLVIGAAILIFKPDFSFWAYDFDARSVFSDVLRGLILLFFAGMGLVKLISRHYRSTLTHAGGKLTSRRGLTSEVSTTIPIPQIHWLEIRQPFFWKRPDWWQFRVRAITTTDEEDNDDASGTQVLMPIASRDQLETLLAHLSPETGASSSVTLPAAFRSSPLAIATAQRARFFNPFAHGHEGLTLADGTLVIRTGRWSTKLAAIPVSNIQGVSLTQGIFQSRLGLAKIEVHGAGEVKDASVTNLDLADATLMFEALIDATRTPASKETVPCHD